MQPRDDPATGSADRSKAKISATHREHFNGDSSPYDATICLLGDQYAYPPCQHEPHYSTATATRTQNDTSEKPRRCTPIQLQRMIDGMGAA